jgi:hypothetical protein
MSETFYITRRALTQGILKAESCEVHEGKWAYRPWPHYLPMLEIGKDAFRTEDEAKARVFELVQAKLKSLAKEKERLEALRNSVEPGNVGFGGYNLDSYG